MEQKHRILDAALLVLRRNQPLTLDSVARQIGLTKPGVVHHFPTKDALTRAVVERVMDLWEAQLLELAGPRADAADRLRAYVRFTLLADFDPSDLALFCEPRMREALAEQWSARLDPWLGEQISADPARRAAARSARLLADGAWFNRAAGTIELDGVEQHQLLDVALRLVDQAANR